MIPENNVSNASINGERGAGFTLLALFAGTFVPLLLFIVGGLAGTTKSVPNQEPRQALYFHLSTPFPNGHDIALEGMAVEFPNW